MCRKAAILARRSHHLPRRAEADSMSANCRRWRVSSIMMLAIAWGAITTVLVLLLIYRSTLSIHEDNQLFLDDSESHMQLEQQQLIVRMNKLQPFVRLFGFASGLLIVLIAGLWIWQGINQM